MRLKRTGNTGEPVTDTDYFQQGAREPVTDSGYFQQGAQFTIFISSENVRRRRDDLHTRPF
jgi:hypothetical protein